MSGPDIIEKIAGTFGGRMPSSAFLFDFDGTLAHIVARPDEAAPLEGVAEGLASLASVAGRVALVSGRPVEDLRSRLDIDGIEYSGLYGMERASGSGPILVHPEAAKWSREVAEVTDMAAAWLRDSGWGSGSSPEEGIEAEPKGLAVTLHYRNATDRERAFESARGWAESVAAKTGMRVVYGKLNVELVPPVETDKGLAVAELADGFECCLYAGDDTGDLPAFERLRDWDGESLCVAVGGAELPAELEASADIVLDGPGEVTEMIAALAAT